MRVLLQPPREVDRFRDGLSSLSTVDSGTVVGVQRIPGVFPGPGGRMRVGCQSRSSSSCGDGGGGPRYDRSAEGQAGEVVRRCEYLGLGLSLSLSLSGGEFGGSGGSGGGGGAVNDTERRRQVSLSIFNSEEFRAAKTGKSWVWKCFFF
jgi:hypothetical protein